ncbi:MAG: WYL domain-containing protein [Candidatus Omnitrophica bacterium]|nr:WYL domain-containing protein [Candidatus Omnitrophota bacterium]MBI2495129.1 WYL domain-containing protein [Candidatus Omnitrophota bacterium]MBI3020597.1 WYL domain-containing protein [Candidatus Omnitrophota bacterium]MBI3083018.1 WYL domain-containing protein [Candidatus Omnitrophota bacterium]
MGEKLVLDLETQRDFNEVEGRRPELLKVSVAGVYSYQVDRYDAYLEADLSTKLGPRLQEAELLIGFNIRRFDLPVLQPYLPYLITTLPVLDIMEEVVKNLGHRLSLESLARATLGRGKSGHGLDALRWFKEGRFDLITRYCLDDVKLTKELYDYGKQHGRLFAASRFSEEKFQIPVCWPERKRESGTIVKMLTEAFEKRLQVEIEYLSQSVASGESAQRSRRVDVYHIREPYFEGYCHFREDVRQFRIDRVIDIKPTWQRYTIPPDFVPTSLAE